MIKITLCFPIPTHTSQPGFVQAEPAFVGAATSNWQRSATTHEGMRTSLSCSSSNPHLFASTHGCMSYAPGWMQVTLHLPLELLLTWQLPAVKQLPRVNPLNLEMFSEFLNGAAFTWLISHSLTKLSALL